MQRTSDRVPFHSAPLDGMRFFAFFAVFLLHAMNTVPAFHYTLYGSLGVQVFFVLSGFLIGGILLTLRDRTDLSTGTCLKLFYIRRALRIFPIYYVTLALIFLTSRFPAQLMGEPDYLPWHAAYLSNLYMFLTKNWAGHSQSHFWSLAVEEQFYLLAPLMILLLPIRRLTIGFAALWALVGAARVVFYLQGETLYSFASFLTPMQFDCLTVGMAAAILQKKGSFLGVRRPHLAVAGPVCLALYVLNNVADECRLLDLSLLDVACGQWFISVASASLIIQLWNGAWRPLGAFFAWKPFCYLGKISYGLYVLHPFFLTALDRYLTPSEAPYLYMTCGLALSTAAASLSWHLLESPVNSLKDRFSYPPDPARVPSRTVSTAQKFPPELATVGAVQSFCSNPAEHTV